MGPPLSRPVPPAFSAVAPRIFRSVVRRRPLRYPRSERPEALACARPVGTDPTAPSPFVATAPRTLFLGLNSTDWLTFLLYLV